MSAYVAQLHGVRSRRTGREYDPRRFVRCDNQTTTTNNNDQTTINCSSPNVRCTGAAVWISVRAVLSLSAERRRRACARQQVATAMRDVDVFIEMLSSGGRRVDATVCEGFVVRDAHYRRLKLKSPGNHSFVVFVDGFRITDSFFSRMLNCVVLTSSSPIRFRLRGDGDVARQRSQRRSKRMSTLLSRFFLL